MNLKRIFVSHQSNTAKQHGVASVMWPTAAHTLVKMQPNRKLPVAIEKNSHKKSETVVPATWHHVGKMLSFKFSIGQEADPHQSLLTLTAQGKT